MNIRLFKPSVGVEELEMIKKSFERSWIGLGPNVNEFEKQWEEFSGSKMAIGVNSATAALHLALSAFKFPEGKKVLVIHPFKDSIEQQYKKKNLLFSNNLLPNFELITLKAVQSVANETTHYKDWFEALEYMKNEMNKVNFDIALIGCGAYGLHLAAHAKKIGKKGFHIGGVLQIIFGIIGTRYENPNQSGGVYLKLFNKNWIRPSKDETPKDAHLVEKNTYW